MENSDEQEDELAVLRSIYENEKMFISAKDKKGGELSLPLQLPEQPFYIVLSEKQATKALNLGAQLKKTEDGAFLIVKYLPPLLLHFQYPDTYPSTEAPSFTLLSKWLTTGMLKHLCSKLDDLWLENRGMAIMYTWSEFLINDALASLKITSPYKLNLLCHNTEKMTSHEPNTSKIDGRAVQELSSPEHLLKNLIDYDREECEAEFRRSYFLCSVCFSEKAGVDCMKFYKCCHVYCNKCLKSYFEIQIKEGNVQSLGCPDPECENSQATPLQVHNLVGNELFTQYDRLLLQSTLQSMDDIVYCPRLECQTPVMMEKGSNLGQCPKCHLTFCFFCRMTYHGVSPCRIRKDELQKIREEYESADASKKIYMEHRYGKKTIQRALEDFYSEEWLESNSKKCPSCGTHIQKIDGCNKMTCTKCRTYFCWLCSHVLSSSNPYSHFSSPTAPCFNRLFEGITDEDEMNEFDLIQNAILEAF